MRLLSLRRLDRIAESKHVVAVFGVGLIGSAVVSALRLKARLEEETLPLEWEDSAIQELQLERIGNRISEFLEEGRVAGTNSKFRKGSTDVIRRFSLIWSAGKCGFSASLWEIESELANFQRIVGLAGDISIRITGAECAFHLISSAGGLFEGKTHVVVS